MSALAANPGCATALGSRHPERSATRSVSSASWALRSPRLLEKPWQRAVLHLQPALTDSRGSSSSSSSSMRGPMDCMAFWNQDDVPDLGGKVYIITGGNSGIGFETAKGLVKHNGHVVLASRSLQKSQQAADELNRHAQGSKAHAEAMTLNLADFKSIEAFVSAFKAKNLPLNCLINNAGIFLVPYDHTEDGFEITIGTNYYGPFYLTHLLLDKLQQSAPSRVVHQSSITEVIGTLDWNDLELKKSKESGLFEYGSSKLRMIMFGRELNKGLKGTGVESFISQPGLINSPIYDKADHKKFTTNLFDFFRKIYGQGPKSGCLSELRAATDPTLQGMGGTYYSPPYIGLVPIPIDNAGKREPYNGYARDQAAWARLYEVTMEQVNERARMKGLPTIQPASQALAAIR